MGTGWLVDRKGRGNECFGCLCVCLGQGGGQARGEKSTYRGGDGEAALAIGGQGRRLKRRGRCCCRGVPFGALRG